MRVVLISPYEIGRQPFGLAEPAAFLVEAGFEVTCLDLSLQRLDERALAQADLVGLYLAMHTATRIAVEALPRIRALAPRAALCAYGLYAPVNAERLHALGVETVLGGEAEPALLDLAQRLAGQDPGPRPPAHHPRVRYKVPDRTLLPALERYSRLLLPDGTERTVAFAEASRGCKHLCRHCPVVPVYGGRFRAIPVEVVLEDIAGQIRAGATHVSFGDPDFLNGPGHARRLVDALHAAWPTLTWDATVKVQHIIDHQALLPRLRETGCLFLTSAVESVEDEILAHLDKNHTEADFETATRLLARAGIGLAPTFVAFTPWTTLTGYRRLLETLVRLRLVEAVPPVQLAIRLLVPEGSRLLELAGFRDRLEPFDPALLGYPWRHDDPRVDALQARVQTLAERAEAEGWPRRRSFASIWALAHEALGEPVPALPAALGESIARHSEPWYCCAEPTQQQLAAL